MLTIERMRNPPLPDRMPVWLHLEAAMQDRLDVVVNRPFRVDPPFDSRGGGKTMLNLRAAADSHRMLANDSMDQEAKRVFNLAADLYEQTLEAMT